MAETQWIGQNALKQRCSLSAVAGVYSHHGVDYSPSEVWQYMHFAHIYQGYPSFFERSPVASDLYSIV